MEALISIVLVEVEHPDNIGAAARAMKNMGLRDLRLVKPPPFWKEKGKKMALHAYDLLEEARVYEHLQSAVKDACLVVGTTRRHGRRRGRFLDFDETILKIRETAVTKKVAIVFGKESKGLSNNQLMFCDWVTTIPADSEYASLNLAQAVLLVAFSLFRASAHGKASPRAIEEDFLPKDKVEETLVCFKEGIDALGYKPFLARRVLNTFRALLKRSGLKHSESQMIKGLARRIKDLSMTYPSEHQRRYLARLEGEKPPGI